MPLSPLAMIKQIDAGRTVIAGSPPSGMRYPPEFWSTCLIIGYSGGPDLLTLTVNDPFFFERQDRDSYGASRGEGIQRG